MAQNLDSVNLAHARELRGRAGKSGFAAPVWW
jgi:hypothetical protein